MKTERLLQEAREHAFGVLLNCVTDCGFRASAGSAGYPQIWARDSAITALGAAACGEARLLDAVKSSLDTLSDHQSPNGLVPLNVNVETRATSTENAGALDANLWYVLTQFLYWLTRNDAAFLAKNWPKIDRAMCWLSYQDMNECGLLETPEAGNWMDLIAVRYNILYDNVLYYAAVLAHAAMHRALPSGTPIYRSVVDAAGVLERINLLMWIDRCWVADHFAEHLDRLKAIRLEWFMLYHNIGTISSRPYYLPFVAFREYGDWFDSLGNCLAILCGVADGHHRQHILRYMHQVGIAEPFPTKAIHPPIYPGEKDWRQYYRSRNLNLPHQYHNGGIWPMVGGFHVAALVRHGEHKEARRLLKGLAKANLQGVNAKWEFNEWLHGESGQAMGYERQAWSAAMYLFADTAVRERRLPLFDALLDIKPPAAIAAENNVFDIAPGGGPVN